MKTEETELKVGGVYWDKNGIGKGGIQSGNIKLIWCSNSGKQFTRNLNKDLSFYYENYCGEANLVCITNNSQFIYLGQYHELDSVEVGEKEIVVWKKKDIRHQGYTYLMNNGYWYDGVWYNNGSANQIMEEEHRPLEKIVIPLKSKKEYTTISEIIGKNPPREGLEWLWKEFKEYGLHDKLLLDYLKKQIEYREKPGCWLKWVENNIDE